MKLVNHILDSKGNEIWHISPESSVLEAIKLMAEKKIGALLVMEGKNLKGVISERDYARKVILEGRSSKETPVRDIMTSQVTVTGPGEKVEKCLALMTNGHFRHLPVVEEGEVIGVLSIGDLVKAIIADQQFQIEQLESFIETGY
jgi:CBS domain-containing protein